MDTGDAPGDLFFLLDEFLLPLQCADPTYFYDKFECLNPEHRSKGLVATELELEVDARFTNYSGCNFCTGTDPFTHKPCEAGTYVCDCMNFLNPKGCDRRLVGMETVVKEFVHDVTDQCKETLEDVCGHVRYSKWCPLCLARHQKLLNQSTCSAEATAYCPGIGFPLCASDSKNFDCWHMNIARKTQGLWFSTFREGYCDDTEKPCSWKVLASRTIQEDCIKTRLVETVEDEGSRCFEQCGTRNQSSPCWVGCFFTTVLGPEAHNSTRVTGMPLEKLTDAWTGSFQVCPPASLENQLPSTVGQIATGQTHYHRRLWLSQRGGISKKFSAVNVSERCLDLCGPQNLIPSIQLPALVV
ncbi:unnamed protein product [Durusdinium trenchii]|uniref:Uncharacterized protein n=1 Tax=Durusdinium trenchii TaxID=1381693 RepID=A0ABP0L7F4_9DINO